MKTRAQKIDAAKAGIAEAEEFKAEGELTTMTKELTSEIHNHLNFHHNRKTQVEVFQPGRGLRKPIAAAGSVL